MRPRDVVGKARKSLALDHAVDVERLDRHLTTVKDSISDVLAEHPSECVNPTWPHCGGVFWPRLCRAEGPGELGLGSVGGEAPLPVPADGGGDEQECPSEVEDGLDPEGGGEQPAA